jgi:hypothetical protein
MIAEPSVTAFLFGDNDRRGVARVKVLRGRSKRAGPTTITTTEPEVPANPRWADRRAMKRAR